MTCEVCGGPSLGTTNICSLCANTKPNFEFGKKGTITVTAPAAAAVIAYSPPSFQNKKTVQSKDAGTKGYIDDFVDGMIPWLTARGHWGASAATGLGEQGTPHNCEDGTTSLDFQGVRAGSPGSGVFWIDLQLQKGGSGDKRKTYAQVLIQCTGQPPTAAQIATALHGSVGAGRRAVLHLPGGLASTPT